MSSRKRSEGTPPEGAPLVVLVIGEHDTLRDAVTLELARLGARVVVNDLGVAADGSGRDESAGQGVVDEIKSIGGEAVAHFGDVADWNDSKAMIEMAAGESIMATYANTEAKNPAAMNNMLAKYGVTNHRWPDSTLATFEKAWVEVVKEESAKDPWFKEIADSFYAFRDQYRGWGEAQALKSTYLK